MTRRRPRAVFAAALAAAAAHAGAAGPADCAAEPDDTRRLACYDALFRTAPAPAAPAGGTGLQVPEHPGGGLAAPAPGPRGSLSVMSRFWELDRADKHGTFVVRTYLPNFVLPLRHTSRLNHAPHSPTRGVGPAPPNARHLAAKLQVSLRAKVAQSLLLPDADLWFAFTQRALWQLWDHEDSAPFRSTDYQPEAVYIVPVPPRLRGLPFGWQWRMVQLGIAHQSNGQSNPLSRSWNRVYLGVGLERGEFGLQLRAAHRLREKDDDDNPDLTDYLGRGELVASWLPGLATASLTWRTNLRAPARGSVQFDWTYPVDSDQPEGLRWYVQLFSGYGETLLDYNHRQTSVGVGLTLFQF